MILQPVISIFHCSPLPSWTWQTPGLSNPRCCFPTSSSVCLVFSPLSLCLARWFWPNLMNGRHDHTISCSLHLFTMIRRSWCGLVTWSLTLLSSCPNQLLNTLQKVQNSAARLVFNAQKQEHIQPFLQNLHWLPVHSRIQYKISTLCFNSFS